MLKNTTHLRTAGGAALHATRSLPSPTRAAHDSAAMVASAVVAGMLLGQAPALAEGVTFKGVPSSTASPVHVEMLVDGMTVEPAAKGFLPGTGHFHVLVDAPDVDEGVDIPFDATHLHYGKGQTEADVDLAPGRHKLTLQFANALHQSYGPVYRASVDVDVQ